MFFVGAGIRPGRNEEGAMMAADLFSLIKESLAPQEVRGLLEDVLTSVGEGKRVVAGLTCLSRRHGANTAVEFVPFSDCGDGILVLYSHGGTWSSRSAELQFPTWGDRAVLHVRSKTPYGQPWRPEVYTYDVPKALAASYLAWGLIHWGDYQIIREGTDLEVDETFWDYPELVGDERDWETCVKNGCDRVRTAAEGAPVRPWRPGPWFIEDVFFPPIEGGERIQVGDLGKGDAFYAVFPDGGRTCVLRHFNGDEAVVVDAVGGYTTFEGERHWSFSCSHRWGFKLEGAAVYRVTARQCKRWEANRKKAERRIRGQRHFEPGGPIQDWEWDLIADRVAPEPHGFGDGYIGKYLS